MEQNDFLQKIREIFRQQISTIIEEAEKVAKDRDSSALETLEFVDGKVEDWVSSVSGYINISTGLEEIIKELKAPIVQKVKQEFIAETQKVIAENDEGKIFDKMKEIVEKYGGKQSIEKGDNIWEKIRESKSTDTFRESVKVPDRPKIETGQKPKSVKSDKPYETKYEEPDNYIYTGCGGGGC